MEEGQKKIIMIVIIVACIIAAVVITVATRGGGGGEGVDSLKRGTMIWVKCRDPKCEYAWQMDKKDYFQYIEDNRDGMVIPALECPKCHGKTGYRAEKCPKCGTIFERDATSATPDKCPKCGYSAIEELRNKVRHVKPTAETKEKE
jgi:ribosomal protein L40E